MASVGDADNPHELGSFPVSVPNLRYGFALDTFAVHSDTIRSGEYLGTILAKAGVDYPTIDRIAENAKDVFAVNKFRVNHPYTLLTLDTATGPDYFIYEPNVYEYVVFELKDSLEVHLEERPIEITVSTLGGAIQSSLWNAMVGQGASWELASKMEDALQWSVDFHHLQQDDEFRLIYDEHYIDGRLVGAGHVHAAHYKTGAKEFYAIYFEDTKNPGYYDLEGRPMKGAFLKAPVKYSRISSYYNPNRFHPILKRRRPHLGTDYAAPYGTPIYAVGNGIVIEASYTKGNGNYVKIRHDKTHMTQYLHMQKFAKGIRPGVPVRQGEVIGYVGSTGLATGPHVCFRFWKNGRQVNHLNLNFPPPEPLPEADMPAFEVKRDSLLAQLQEVEIVRIEETPKEEQQL